MIKNFVQVDAFADRPLLGNPAAVVFDAADLSPQVMQNIAREMNLSETVFILPPTIADADYRVRIFTPHSELPFAGHPTIAAAHTVLTHVASKRHQRTLTQECGIGLVPIDVVDHRSTRVLRMTQGAPQFRDAHLTTETLARMLGCGIAELADRPAEVVSTGVPWLIVELSRPEAISHLSPDHRLIAQECRALKAAGLTVFVEQGPRAPARLRVRTFAPGEGVLEDPVCGSGNGSVAAVLAERKHSRETRGAYVAEQGVEIGRRGEVHASWAREGATLRVMIAGTAVTVIAGQLHL